MADETVKIVETTKEYELQKSDVVPASGDDEPSITNKIAGTLDKFRVIPRLVMLAYCWAFYASIQCSSSASSSHTAAPAAPQAE